MGLKLSTLCNKISPNNIGTTPKPRKKHYRIDEMYTYLSYISLFDKCHQLIAYQGYGNKTDLDENTVDVLTIFTKIDNAIKSIDDELQIGIFQEENDWFLNYLRSHYSFNILINKDNGKDNIDDITYHLLNLIKNSNGTLNKTPVEIHKKINTKIKNNKLNFKLYKHMETFNLSNRIDYVKKELSEEISKKYTFNMIDTQNIIGLCHKNINLDLIDLIFNVVKETYQKDPMFVDLMAYAQQNSENDIELNKNYAESKINNVKILLYKVYFNLIKNQVIQEYKSAVIKTAIYCNELSQKDAVDNGFEIKSEKMQQFLTKYNEKQGIPLNKIKETVLTYLLGLLDLVRKHNE